MVDIAIFFMVKSPTFRVFKPQFFSSSITMFVVLKSYFSEHFLVSNPASKWQASETSKTLTASASEDLRPWGCLVFFGKVGALLVIGGKVEEILHQLVDGLSHKKSHYSVS